MGRVVMVVSDALRDDVAAARMGYLEHLVELRRATRYTLLGELPSLSRPMYETLHTGLPVAVHGITSNQTIRLSESPHVFRLAVEAGLTTAAASYFWFSELYNRVPFDRLMDREVDDAELWIQHGRFYTEDDFPDTEVFQAAGTLAVRWSPDYLLVHPMGMDYSGEAQGADSAAYRNHATFQDILLANSIPLWHRAGYTVIVTGDHGINNDRSHGGTTDDVRLVPLYLAPADGRGAGDTRRRVSQLHVAPTVCQLLGLKPAQGMTHRPLGVTPVEMSGGSS